ncbi:MAG: glycosyltransferase family 4 protein [Parachlamydiales bacterium]|nr:glycosyltransferase family 4 protein [Parachlamydiales bacterium]
MKIRILHTEASSGWGGQEMRVLREAIGMRLRGYDVELAVISGGKLIEKARAEGFVVHEIPFKGSRIKNIMQLSRLFKKEQYHIVNTHSSKDAWLAGIAARVSGARVIRTRHISSNIRTGLNSKIVYNHLADQVVTTCQETADTICLQADLTENRCCSIPTGVDPSVLQVSQEDVKKFRDQWGIKDDDCLIGTACVLRSWKGISDFLQAAKKLQDHTHLKWMIVGNEASEGRFQKECRELGLENSVIFTGYLTPPYTAIASFDIFVLLSTASEGVSQASLQAAYLEKPLVTTPVGGLKEVCINNQTGILVSPASPYEVANAVMDLAVDKSKRIKFGKNAKSLVEDKFTFNKTLDQMEAIYKKLLT